MSWRKLRAAAVGLSLGLMAQVASGALVPGALVDLDAANNATAADNKWTNNGTAGGVLGYTAAFGAPTNKPTRGQDTATYYQPNASAWGNNPRVGTEPSLSLENFSVEVWLKRLGTGTGDEHQIMGISNATEDQYIQLLFREGAGQGNDNIADVFLKGKNTTRIKSFNVGGANAVIADNVYTQLTITYEESSGSLNVFRDGTNVGSVANAQDFVSSEAMNTFGIFKSNAIENNDRALNGFISRVRVYDFPLTESQVQSNFAFGNTTVPEPAGMAMLGLLSGLFRRAKRSA